MTNHNPSVAARTLVLTGPALALLFTVFAIVTVTGVGFIRGVWFGAGPLELPHRVLVRPVARVPPWRLVRLQSP